MSVSADEWKEPLLDATAPAGRVNRDGGPRMRVQTATMSDVERSATGGDGPRDGSTYVNGKAYDVIPIRKAGLGPRQQMGFKLVKKQRRRGNLRQREKWRNRIEARGGVMLAAPDSPSLVPTTPSSPRVLQEKRKLLEVKTTCVAEEVDIGRLVRHWRRANRLRLETPESTVAESDASGMKLRHVAHDGLPSHKEFVAKREARSSLWRSNTAMQMVEVSKIVVYSDTLFLELAHGGSVFIMAYGVLVLWDVPERLEILLEDAITPFMESVLPQNDRETDDMDYAPARDAGPPVDVIGEDDMPVIKSDVISLSTHKPREKLACSFALAQSAKLSCFEQRVEGLIKDTKHMPEELAREGKIGLSQRDLSKMMGVIFMERSDVNLHSDILDTPEFFWEDDRFLDTFRSISDYMEIGRRLEVLNSRLDVLKELLDMLAGEAENRHASKLEWIIIWLIVAEVVVEVVWDVILKGLMHVE